MDVRDRFRVHPDFPALLKDWTREVLRYQPENVVEFSRDYFTALASDGMVGTAQLSLLQGPRAHLSAYNKLEHPANEVRPAHIPINTAAAASATDAAAARGPAPAALAARRTGSGFSVAGAALGSSDASPYDTTSSSSSAGAPAHGTSGVPSAWTPAAIAQLAALSPTEFAARVELVLGSDAPLLSTPSVDTLVVYAALAAITAGGDDDDAAARARLSSSAAAQWLRQAPAEPHEVSARSAAELIAALTLAVGVSAAEFRAGVARAEDRVRALGGPLAVAARAAALRPIFTAYDHSGRGRVAKYEMLLLLEPVRARLDARVLESIEEEEGTDDDQQVNVAEFTRTLFEITASLDEDAFAETVEAIAQSVSLTRASLAPRAAKLTRLYLQLDSGLSGALPASDLAAVIRLIAASASAKPAVLKAAAAEAAAAAAAAEDGGDVDAARQALSRAADEFEDHVAAALHRLEARRERTVELTTFVVTALRTCASCPDDVFALGVMRARRMAEERRNAHSVLGDDEHDDHDDGDHGDGHAEEYAKHEHHADGDHDGYDDGAGTVNGAGDDGADIGDAEEDA